MTDGASLPSDKANRVAEAIESIERDVTALRRAQSQSRSEYESPDNRDRRDSVERKFEKLAEAMLDIADQLVKHERGRSPSSRKETIRALNHEGILSTDSRRTCSMRSDSGTCFLIRTARSSTTISRDTCRSTSRHTIPMSGIYSYARERTHTRSSPFS